MKSAKFITTVRKTLIYALCILVLCSFASAAFVSYQYPYYSFKLDTSTGALVNLTVKGQTAPVLKNITHEFFNASGGRYTRTSANASVYLNTTLEDIILISYALKSSTGARICVVNETWKFFEDNQTFYGEVQVRALPGKICPIYKVRNIVYSNGANYVDKLSNNAGWRGYSLTGSGNYRMNTSTFSGSGTNIQYPNVSYIAVINGSNGWLAMGSIDKSSNMANGYYNTEFSPSWMIADVNDEREMANAMPEDYIMNSPNMTLLAYDGATDKYLMREIVYNGYTGLGFTRSRLTTWNLTYPVKVRNKEVAQDFFRVNLFFQLRNATGKYSYKAPVQALKNDSDYTSGEIFIIGAGYLPFMFKIYDGKNWGLTIGQNLSRAGTHAHFRDDNNITTSTIAKQTHLDYCLELLREWKEWGGWYRYPDIKTGWSTWWGDTFMGNGEESLYSCAAVLGTSWLDKHRDVKSLIYGNWLNTGNIYKINNNEYEGKRQRYTLTIRNTYFEVNRSYDEVNPDFLWTGNIAHNPGGFYVYLVGLKGLERLRVCHITCNSTDGTRLWYDTMATNNQSNYNRSKFTYNSAYNCYEANITLAGDSAYMGPKAATRAVGSKWVNYTCSFDIWIPINISSGYTAATQWGYFSLYMRRNHSDTDINFARYRIGSQTTSSVKAGYPTKSEKSKNVFLVQKNDSKGVYWANWSIRTTNYANTSAWYAMSNPRSFNHTTMSHNIVNQKQYWDIAVAERVFMSKFLNNTGNYSYYSYVIDRIMDGNNWMNTNAPQGIRRDGFWEYSLQNLNHDSGYFWNSMSQLSKVMRAKPNTSKFLDLPFISYYIRYGRENHTDFSAVSNNWVVINALMAMSDTRITGYTLYKSTFRNSVREEDKIMTLYPSEMANPIYFAASNCSQIFNNKIGIYYPDSHVIAKSAGTIYNVVETCTNIRLKTLSNIVVDDAYQTNGTTNVYLKLLPIKAPRHSWNLAATEAYPLGTLVGGASATYWDYSKHRWAQNSTHYIYNTTSMIVSKAASVTLQYDNALGNKDYTVSVNGIKKTGFTTNAAGSGSATFTTLAANSNVTITQETYASGSNYHLIATNITNNSIINWSRLNGYIAARFISENISSDWITMLVDGAFSTWKHVNNNTWTTLSRSNITPGTRTIIISTDYNQTAAYQLIIRNITGNSSGTNSTDVFETAAKSFLMYLPWLIPVVILIFVIPVLYGVMGGRGLSANPLQQLALAILSILIIIIAWVVLSGVF